MNKHLTLALAFASLSHLGVNAEVAYLDSIYVDAHTSLSGVTNDELNPLWLYSNEWGRYTQYDQFEGTLGFDVRASLLRMKNIQVEVGLGADLNGQLDESYVHNAYLAAKLFMFDLEVGMRPYSPAIHDDQMTSGSYLMSSNARPQPRVGFGIYDWWGIPGTNHWVEVRGACYVGRLMNEDDERFTQDVLLHEKCGYLRVGNERFKFYAGLVHSVMMGGVLPSGDKMPTDFWASFLGKGSDKFSEEYRGETTNAAGGHMAFWDVGFDLNLQNGSTVKFYFMRMYSDSGVFRPYNFHKNHDFISGVIVNTSFKPLNSFCVEYFNTTHQGGEGIPDPTGYDKNGELVIFYPGDSNPNPREWALEHFEEEDILTWESSNGTIKTDNNVRHFLRYLWDQGDHGGRYTYLNNGMYKQGWSYNGLSLGTPLYHSWRTVDLYRNGEGNVQNKMFFTNNRVFALTFSVKGSITNALDYRLKYTFSSNHGSLQEKYDSSTRGTTVLDDYYYSVKRREHYLLLDLNYRLTSSFKLRCSLAGDFGDLYNSVGMRFGFAYQVSNKR